LSIKPEILFLRAVSETSLNIPHSLACKWGEGLHNGRGLSRCT
jgi:hypothetical protein